MRGNCSRVFASLLLVAVALTASVPALAAYGVPTLNQTACPSLSQFSIDLVICGDVVTGAPAGVTVQWKKCSDYDVSGWADDGTLCALSLSGMPGRDHGAADSRWDLGPGACQTIRIGDNLFDETGASVSGTGCTDPLECGTCYVFRTFAHADRNDKKSAFSDNFYCATADCDNGACTRTQGYWKTHGPGDCHNGNNANLWPAGFTLCMLTQAQICADMNTPVGPSCGPHLGANARLQLEHQLVAALLNLQVNGTDGSCLGNAIATATSLVCANVTACVGVNTALGAQMNALASTLDDYNNGLLSCAKHCLEPPPPGSGRLDPNGTAPTKKASWGELKTIYR